MVMPPPSANFTWADAVVPTGTRSVIVAWVAALVTFMSTDIFDAVPMFT